MGNGTARSGHLFCKQKISWVRCPSSPLIIRLGEAFEFTVLSWPYRLAVRTSAFHAENPSSILGRVIRLMQIWRLLRKFLGTYTEKSASSIFSIFICSGRQTAWQQTVNLPAWSFSPMWVRVPPRTLWSFSLVVKRPTVYRKSGVQLPYGPLSVWFVTWTYSKPIPQIMTDSSANLTIIYIEDVV